MKRTNTVRRRSRTRLDMNLSVSASAALARRTQIGTGPSRSLVVNSMLSRYADLMAESHATTANSKFNASEIEALRGVLSRGKHLSYKDLWLQDRATCRMDFARAIRKASKDSAWGLSPSRTSKLLRILESILSTDEYFGLIDYLTLDPSAQPLPKADVN